MDEWWIEPLRRAFGGRSVVLAGAMGASWTEHIDLLRSVGAERLLVVATAGRGAGPQPDVPTVIVEPPDGLSEMQRIHAADRALADPTPEMVDALDRFDPHREAIVVGTFLATTARLAGRPLLAHRRPEWVALEDKVVVDAFWDRAGVERQPSVVVSLDEAAGAARSIDRGDGTVWAADAREGFHGGAHHIHWVIDDATLARAITSLAPVCDRVRVMPFLEGIPCSIHGIVLPDGVSVLRPVEMVTLRRGNEFVYTGCATSWDPTPAVREQMRSIARRTGQQLGDEVGFRGAFTVDGVVTADGFWPTELNPRFGAGIMTIARGADLPIVLVNDLIVAGHDIGRTSVQLETDIVAAGDERRGGGTWMGGLDHDLEAIARPAAFDGAAWTWAVDDREAAGRVTAAAGFIRCVYDQTVTPVGPPTADRAARFWEFIARETGADTADLTPAPSVTSRV
ncbi:MAG: ATP-grasp domain-containing protein [Ilumatobacteraceae bacterium]